MSLQPEAERPQQPLPSAARDPVYDVYKGLAILAVLMHHVSGIGIRATVRGSASHLAAVVANRFLLFCVPAFLFLSVLLLSRSLLRRPMGPPEFWRHRFPRILLPYLFWSVFYASYNAAIGLIPRASLLDRHRWGYWLAFGKASFHLYFLVILIQIYLILPGLVEAARGERSPGPDREHSPGPDGERDGVPDRLRAGGRGTRIVEGGVLLLAAGLIIEDRIGVRGLPPGTRALYHLAEKGVLCVALYLLVKRLVAWASRRAWGLWGWVALAFGIQIGLYWAHKLFIHSSAPASLALWYAVPVLMGIWLAAHPDEFQSGWRRIRWPLGALTVLAFVLFVPAALQMVDTGDVSPYRYAVTYWAYTGQAAIWLLGFSRYLVERSSRLNGTLVLLGAYSMELYLIHPALLSLVSRVPLHGGPVVLLAGIAAILVAVTLATLALAMALRRIGLGRVLFGR